MEERRNFKRGLDEPSAFTMICDSHSLDEVCAVWADCPFLALDTEFIRTSTFYPKVGLIQVCDGRQNYLIDPLVIEDWSRFKELMFSPTVLKIFHSCSEDLLVFFAFLEVIPAPIFDTQIANAFLNQGFALSYQNMVKQTVDVDLPKGETRSDWLQRPLSDDQLQYAALDVAYLPQIYALQSEQLEQQGKLQWLLEECKRLISVYEIEVNSDFSDYYLNFKAAWQLENQELAALQKLAAWREVRARTRDKPRTWIVKDKPLLEIARCLPQNMQALTEITELSPNFIHYEGEEILEIIASVQDLTADELPQKIPRPLSSSQKNKLKKAQKWIEDQAHSLTVPIEILARKRCLMALYQNILTFQTNQQDALFNIDNIEVPEELQGWRKDLLLTELSEILQ